MTGTPHPYPGSDAALIKGCRCSRDENKRGRGFRLVGKVAVAGRMEERESEPFFVIGLDCELHGLEQHARGEAT